MEWLAILGLGLASAASHILLGLRINDLVRLTESNAETEALLSGHRAKIETLLDRFARRTNR